MRRVLNSKFRHGVLSILAMTALSVTFAAGAQAQEILSAGALFGGVGQSRAVCYVYNSGDSNLDLTGFQITAPDGIAVAPLRNECGLMGLRSQRAGRAASRPTWGTSPPTTAGWW